MSAGRNVVKAGVTLSLSAGLLLLGPAVWAEDSPDGSTSSQTTVEPTDGSTDEPTDEPTTGPTDEPTIDPTDEPTVEPTDEPTIDPTDEPTVEPTDEPTVEPTDEPTDEPTVDPTEGPGVDDGTGCSTDDTSGGTITDGDGSDGSAGTDTGGGTLSPAPAAVAQGEPSLEEGVVCLGVLGAFTGGGGAVERDATAAGAPQLPLTGAPVGLLALLGGGMVALGGTSVLVARDRRT